MKRPSLRLVRYILILLLLTLIVYGLYDHLQQSLPAGFSALIEEVDTLAAQGRQAEAVDLLRGSAGRTFSSYQSLLLLKRIHAMEAADTGRELLIRYSRTAAERFPGREEFAALLCRGLIDAGRPGEAYSIAVDSLREDRFLGLAVEAAISAGLSPGEELLARAEGSEYRYAGLVRIAGGEENPDLMRAVANEWKRDEFYADAALLLAERGDIDEANRLIRTYVYQRFPLLAMQIAYDAADAAHGLAAIDAAAGGEKGEDPLLQLYRADFLLFGENSDRALAVYREIIDRSPGYSVIPWLNSALLAPERREQLLDAGIERFPDSPALVEQAAEYRYRSGATGEARELFQRLLEIVPEHPGAKLRLADTRLRAGSRGGDAQLWDAWREEEEGTRLGLFLAWRLYGRRDAEGLALLAEGQRRRGGSDASVIDALSNILRGDYQAGAAAFGEAYGRFPHWEYRYDQALLEMQAGQFDSAVDHLQEVEAVLKPRGEAAVAARSTVWVALAESHLALGNGDEAANAAAYALDLDPGNLRAALLRGSMRDE